MRKLVDTAHNQVTCEISHRSLEHGPHARTDSIDSCLLVYLIFLKMELLFPFRRLTDNVMEERPINDIEHLKFCNSLFSLIYHLIQYYKPVT